MGLPRLRLSIEAKIAEAAELERRFAENVGDPELAVRLRTIWSECDVLAERIAGIEPRTVGDLVAYAMAFEWLEGGLARAPSDTTEQMIQAVMGALVSMRPDEPFVVPLSAAPNPSLRAR